MPYEITYVDEQGGIITTYWGIMTDNDLINSGQEKYFLQERLKSYRYAITDLSRVEQFKLTAKGIQSNVEIASKISKENHELIVAFVMPTDVEYGMGRMWQAYGEHYGIESFVCRTRAEAEEWIEKKIKAGKTEPGIPDQ